MNEVITDSAVSASSVLNPPQPFEKPSPGTWFFDASHCERPLPRIMWGVLEEAFTGGNREGAAAYGLLLDTVEMRLVNGFMFVCVRPLGAPPEPRSNPPRFLFKLMMALHPGIRRRLRISEEAIRGRLWREETDAYLERANAVEERLQGLLSLELEDLDERELLEHLQACRKLAEEDAWTHYRVNMSRIIPVGDLIAHVSRWTDIEVSEILQALRGTSPNSEEGLAELEALAALVRENPEARSILERSEEEGEEATVKALREHPGGIGDAMRIWLDRIAHRTSGFSVGYPTLGEMPSTLVQTLKAAVESPNTRSAKESGEEACARLRTRIPQEHQESFDELMEEARSVYFLRDHCTQRNTATFGLLRLAALEVGRRLVDRGLLVSAEAALDLRIEEVEEALMGGRRDFEEANRWYAWRMAATSEGVPEILGPDPLEPPPMEWLPEGANRRFLAAIEVYDAAMNQEVELQEERSTTVIKGLGASPGKRQGIARLVLQPGDFDRVQAGDILIARMTAPSYNVLLPMLAGVVTDRGGILSHPAIVSREYGIPGVVGTRCATTTIPDGAEVEIDGDAGTIRVLS